MGRIPEAGLYISYVSLFNHASISSLFPPLLKRKEEVGILGNVCQVTCDLSQSLAFPRRVSVNG